MTQTNTVYFDNSWDPGVRVGIGYNSCNDGWDLDLNWTYYKSSQTEKLSEKENTLYINSWMNPKAGFLSFLAGSSNFAPINSFIRAKYSNRINQFDLEIGRRSWLSRYMIFRPFLGVRGAWGHARLEVSGKVPNSTTAPFTERNFDETTIINQGWGVGIIGGLEPNWHFGCGFNLYGKVGAALLWGDSDIKRNEVVTTSNGSIIQVPNYKDDFSTMLPIIDLSLGLKWEQAYCDQRYMITLSAGWEHHIWFNQNHTPLYGDAETELLGNSPVENTVGFLFQNGAKSQYGNFVFGGFAIRGRFDF